MTRDEHVAWCKKRAHKYLSQGDINNAVTSMLSDLGKHPETKAVADKMAPLGMMYLINRDEGGAGQFIDGFN